MASSAVLGLKKKFMIALTRLRSAPSRPPLFALVAELLISWLEGVASSLGCAAAAAASLIVAKDVELAGCAGGGSFVLVTSVAESPRKLAVDESASLGVGV
ncbi:MAG: hypothetical protein OXC81_07100, partial [Betaproteobacteria bacterium]|nr:hypothetical protein [Betaproteobacteria bacterium]